jgi:hypothetical protein
MIEIESTVHWILRGAWLDGRIATGEGFGRIVPLISWRHRFADEVGVVGWCDKTFRALAALAEPMRPSPRTDMGEEMVTAGRGR